MAARLSIKVSPKARHNRLQGWQGDRLKISVTAAPEKGRANIAVQKLFAELLNIPVSHIQITAGHHHSHKTLSIDNLDDTECHQRLAKLLT